jgi:methionine-R-sulfoxide reductase
MGKGQRLTLLLIFAVIAIWYLIWRAGLMGAFTKQDLVATPAQAPQTHSAEYWTAFKKPDDATLHKELSALEYEVTQKDGTETPFQNTYWNNEQDGIYVDIVSGEPLFSSKDKFDSGTGWPSFSKPLDSKQIVLKDDYALGIKRTEVRSKIADSHLGHLFDDGPPPLGTRYCMNSASLRFIPKDRLAEEGYGEFASLFK